MRVSKEVLEPLINTSLSVEEVVKKLGWVTTGTSHRQVLRLAKEFSISTKHFKGREARRFRVNYEGKRFGRLIALEKIVKTVKNRSVTYYKCLCDCGNIKEAPSAHLQQGITNSCGCLRSEAYKYRRASDRQLVVNRMWGNYRNKSKKKGLNWELTKEEFSKLLEGPCSYCGFENSSKCLGIDRVDNKLGYFPSNCASCCSTCNMSKNNKPLNDFNNWLIRLVKFQIKKGNIDAKLLV